MDMLKNVDGFVYWTFNHQNMELKGQNKKSTSKLTV